MKLIDVDNQLPNRPNALHSDKLIIATAQLEADREAVEKCREKIALCVRAYYFKGSEDMVRADRTTDQIIKMILESE